MLMRLFVVCVLAVGLAASRSNSDLARDLQNLENDVAQLAHKDTPVFAETEAKECSRWDVACKAARAGSWIVGQTANAARTGYDVAESAVKTAGSKVGIGEAPKTGALDQLRAGVDRASDMGNTMYGHVATDSEISRWRHLLTLNPPNSIVDTADPTLRGAEIQRISKGRTRVNVDEYPIEIRCPSGKLPDVGELFDTLRKGVINLGLFFDPDVTIFAPMSARQAERWLTTDKSKILGTTLTIAFPTIPIGRDNPWPMPAKAGFDYMMQGAQSIPIPPLARASAQAIQQMSKIVRGSVVCTEYNRDSNGGSWIFSTVKTQSDGYHPVSGNREFGCRKRSDTSIHCWTKASDRVTGVMEVMTNLAMPGKIVQSQDICWEAFRRRVSDFVKSAYKDCTVERPQKLLTGLDYEDLKNKLSIL